MAIAVTNDFNMNRDQVIADALTMVGAIKPGGSATGGKLDHANRVLNSLVKSIDADGSLIERIVRRTTTTTDGDADFTTATDVLDIHQPMTYLRSGGTARTHIRAITRADYMRISNRTVEGVPQFYLVEKVSPTTVTITLWPVPDATGDTIEYAAAIRVADFDDGSNDPDYPTKFLRALTYGLAADLAPTYGQAALAGALGQEFRAELAKQIQDNNERGDLTLVPFGSSRYASI